MTRRASLWLTLLAWTDFRLEHDRGESRRVMVTHCLVVGLPKA